MACDGGFAAVEAPRKAVLAPNLTFSAYVGGRAGSGEGGSVRSGQVQLDVDQLDLDLEAVRTPLKIRSQSLRGGWGELGGWGMVVLGLDAAAGWGLERWRMVGGADGDGRRRSGGGGGGIESHRLMFDVCDG